MRLTDYLKRRPLQVLLIVAWFALGTVMVVRQPNWWAWFAAVSYVISAVYVVVEVLTWKRVSSQKGRPSGQKDRGAPPSGNQNGNPD